MTPETLDLMADVVEEATGLLREAGSFVSPRAEFLASRCMEYGIRGRRVQDLGRILGQNCRWALPKECQSLGLPSPVTMMRLGVALASIRAFLLSGHGEGAGRILGRDADYLSLILQDMVGTRWKGLADRSWEEWVNEARARCWDGLRGRSAAA